MKILWLAPHPLPHDKNIHPAPWITSLAATLAKEGISITILTSAKNITGQIEKFIIGDYELIAVKAPKSSIDALFFYRMRLKGLRTYIKTIINEFDIVHVHGTEHQYASALKHLNQKAQVIISVQGLLYVYKRYIKDIFTARRILWELGAFYEKKEIASNHNFMCRTNWDTKHVKKINEDANIFTVWEMLRDEFYEVQIDDFGDDIVFSGGKNSLKGLENCLIVYNDFLKKYPYTVLHVIGNCDFAYVEEIISTYKLNYIKRENIMLYGMIDAQQIISIYKKSFCLYHPSIIDNSPNTICEAQISGLPVLATNVGGVSSLIENNITGLLVNNDLREHLSALQNLKNNKKLAHQISLNSRILALKRHDKQSITNQVINIYQKLIE